MYPRLVATWAMALVSFLAVSPSRACLAVADSSYTGPTFVDAERAVIIWDAAHQIEHFIRQASFATGSPDMAFLVPTPETPEIAPVNAALFDVVKTVAAPTPIPPVIGETPWSILGAYGENFNSQREHFNDSPAAATSAGTPLTKSLQPGPVIAEQDVAGYHVTVLATEDFPSIAAWLKTNGYRISAPAEAWIRQYGARHWKLNAFKLIKPPTANDGFITTPPVRLSFHTPAPFYPYSEPTDHQSLAAYNPAGRVLRVAVLSNTRMMGSMADATTWPGELQYAGPSTLRAEQGAQLMNDAGLGTEMPAPIELTTFVDHANPRPGTADVYFAPDEVMSDFRGSETDYTLTPVHRLAWDQPGMLITGFLFMLLVPGAPIYCGVRALVLARRRRERPDEPRRPTPPWLRGLDVGLGIITATEGVFAAAYAGLAVSVGLLGFAMGGPPVPDFGWMEGIGAVGLVFGLSILRCGVLASQDWQPRGKSRHRSFRLTRPRQVEDSVAQEPLDVPVPRLSLTRPTPRRDRVTAVASVIAGGLVLAAFVAALVQSGMVI